MIYKKLDKLQPNFRKKVELFIKKCPGIEIVETYRTASRQNQCYLKGASQIDGYNQKSQHQFGLAVDIKLKGSDPYPDDPSIWRDLANIGIACGLDCGLDLWGYDEGHFQDNNVPLPPKAFVSDWALKSWQKAEKYLEEDMYPRDIIGDNKLEALMRNIGALAQNGEMTLERFLVGLDNLSIFK